MAYLPGSEVKATFLDAEHLLLSTQPCAFKYKACVFLCSSFQWDLLQAHALILTSQFLYL